ncbi:hypothetical protein GCM10025869_14470 [Homoserinibacter gongjuensis]|uniref:Uncharacterized protein n=1 Tax=Homoserinibacter gongjuensis TaxID=1162968 RepID=A0ABQ6JU45_9MICO|nr:hypothetical protein GCM10025869_14470 [Homoserinibacter gongjuensis]
MRSRRRGADRGDHARREAQRRRDLRSGREPRERITCRGVVEPERVQPRLLGRARRLPHHLGGNAPREAERESERGDGSGSGHVPTLPARTETGRESHDSRPARSRA